MLGVVMAFAVSKDFCQLYLLEKQRFPSQKLTLHISHSLYISFLSSVDSNVTAAN